MINSGSVSYSSFANVRNSKFVQQQCCFMKLQRHMDPFVLPLWNNMHSIVLCTLCKFHYCIYSLTSSYS